MLGFEGLKAVDAILKVAVSSGSAFPFASMNNCWVVVNEKCKTTLRWSLTVCVGKEETESFVDYCNGVGRILCFC